MAKGSRKAGSSRHLDTSKLAAFETRQREHVHYQPIGVRAQRRQKAIARMHNGLKPMRFVSLHHHSTYSFLDGFQLPEAHVRRAGEINMQAVAMTEHGNIFSHVKLEKAAEDTGVKPIFGCEFYTGWTDEERRTQRKNHLTVICKNEVGYANLLKLVTMSWKEGFYYEPTVDPRWLVELQEGLIILSGCQGSALFTALVGGKHVEESDASYKRGLRVARWFSDRFSDYYIEVQAFPELDKTRRANPLLARIASALGRPLVATMDCHYTAPEETEVQKILHSCRPGEKQTLEQRVQDWGYDVPLCPPPTDRAIYRRLVATGLTREQAIESIISTEEIAQECKVSLPKLEKPRFPLPKGYRSGKELWRSWLKEGWEYRGIPRMGNRKIREYRRQLRKEMEVIEAKDYVDYFLIVADSIRFAKEQQIPVGPARGSAAASLACYLLRITEVDPIRFPNLVFERFIDWSREDMPDIDMDFAPYGRPIVRDYLVEKYGEECVNNVGTFTMYKPKLALDDVARVHQIDRGDVEQIKEVLLERSSGDLRASASIEDTVDQFDTAYEVMSRHPELQYSMDLEGNAKGFGVHAAGLVVSSEPITTVTSVLEREVKDHLISVVGMDKDDAARQGLEKLDYLSLANLDGVAIALEEIGMKLEELYDIPLDDEKTIDGFRRNDVVGIFQFDGRATGIVNSLVKPDSFDEVAYVNALSRPGPLHNGAAAGYIAAKDGTEEPERIHPALDAITAGTKYQIVFQEQILRIVREVGGFDWTHAAYIRKIISRKLGDQEFNRQWSRFRKGALTLHKRTDYPPMDEETAARIWGMCITAGSYAFNAAHSYSYGMLAFWTMWLKQHYPSAFFAGMLASLRADDKQVALRRDAVKGNGPRKPTPVLPPDLNSKITWRRDDDCVRAGWSQIPGIGIKMGEKIVEHFSPDAPHTYHQLLEVPGIGEKKVEVIQSFCEREDPFKIYTLSRQMERITEDIKKGIKDKSGKNLPVPNVDGAGIAALPPNRPVTFLIQPTHRNLRDVFEKNRAKGIELKPEDIKRPDLAQWMNLSGKDADGYLITSIISRYKFPAYKDMLWSLKLDSDDIVLVQGKKGRVTGWEGGALVFVNRLWVLEAE